MSSISLSMIVKNEEKYLRNCLESVKNVVDEIVLVDTGSTDNTIKVAQEFNAKIYYFDWINDFSAARNFALSQSTGDWILYLDADERISKSCINEIKNLTNSKEKLGVRCLVNSISSNKKNSQKMKYIRLFKNDVNIHFIGKAHEQIEPSLQQNNYKILDSKIEIIHYGYDVSEEKLKKKAKRNLKLLLLDYSKNKNSYLAYQIANSYSILEEIGSSVVYFKKALEDKNLKNELKSICYLYLADFEMRQSNLILAKGFIDKGLKIDKSNLQLILVGSQIYGKLGNSKIAFELCKNAFQLNSETKKNKLKQSDQIIEIDSKKIMYQGLLLSVTFSDKNSFEYFYQKLNIINRNEATLLEKINLNNSLSIEETNNLCSLTNEDNLELILKLFENYNNAEAKLNYLSALYEKFGNNSKILSYFGSFLLSLNQIDVAQQLFETAIQSSDYEDSIIFYLISIYANKNDLNNLTSLLEKAEIRAKKNKLLKEKLFLIKKKLNPLLEKTFDAS